MDVGPSTEPKYTRIKLDDDRVEYATLNHQLVQTGNRPECDLSTIGESQFKNNTIMIQHYNIMSKDTCKQLD